MVNKRLYLYEVSTPELSYIGITIDPIRRKAEHLNYSHNSVLKDSILKHKENTIFKVLCIGSPKYIYSLESKVISEYRKYKVLANISKGGEFSGGLTGEDHWNSTLYEEDIIRIRELAASGVYTHRNIADMYDVGYKAISKIVRGQRWKDIGGPITLERQEVSKVANRRKLTDEEVVYICNTCYFIFSTMGKFNLPDFADIYEVSRQSFRLMLKGKVYTELPRPILGKDYWIDYGR